ncbi:MAG: MBL fold metallo-hydrolase [Verrucomicrobiota bacterium]
MPLRSLRNIHSFRLPRFPRKPKWTQRNFISEVLIPSLLQPRRGKKAPQPLLFPKLKEGQLAITWIGHASFLIQTPKRNVLIDPNWAKWLFIIKRLKHAGALQHQLPNIDLVLITHAHFDHLDRPSLKSIAAQQPIIVPNGVSNLVHRLGFKLAQEMNWWDQWEFEDLKITFTPAKHWGARMVLDRHRLYGGYIIEYQGRKIYHCGDSAYFEGFKEIGRRESPEIALLPIGAYEPPSFRDHHITPEQAVEAFQELNSKRLIPMHYGTYRLSYEPMHEPPQRLMQAAAAKGILPNLTFLTEGLPQVF